MSYYKQVKVVATAGGQSIGNPIPLDRYLEGAPLVACTVSGTATYTVEHTFDNILSPLGPSVANAIWFPHSDTAMVSATTNQESNFISAPVAVRLKVFTGSGEVVMSLIQSGGFPT